LAPNSSADAKMLSIEMPANRASPINIDPNKHPMDANSKMIFIALLDLV